jgi:hypothetical protein
MLGRSGQTKNYTFSSMAPFQAGGPGVSTGTLGRVGKLPGYGVAPAAIGFLSYRRPGSETTPVYAQGGKAAIAGGQPRLRRERGL